MTSRRYVKSPGSLNDFGSLCVYLCLLFLALNECLYLPQANAQETGQKLTPAPRTEAENQVIRAYKRANKTVVNVSTRVELNDFFGGEHGEGSGSGVVIDAKNGYVVTNYHVISGAQRITVTLHDGNTYPVVLVGQDPGSDLALLQIEEPPKNIVSAELADSSALEVGQRVLAIGNPFGLNRTLTTGIVSSLGRTIRAEDGRLIEDIIQIDAAINPGNSGGPLLDTAGRMVGINTAILSRTGESAGIGFAIPVDQIKNALPQLIKYGRVLRPKIGVIILDADRGPVILYVMPGGPAEKAGLSGARRRVRHGQYVGYAIDFSEADFIIEVNGQRVRSKAMVIDIIGKTKLGESIRLKVVRGLSPRAKEREVTVIPELG